MINISTEIFEYFVKRMLNEATSYDTVNWAKCLVNEGYHSLSLVALVNAKEPFSDELIDYYFEKVLEELKWELPDKDELLREYINYISQKIIFGQIDPVEAIDRIRQVIHALGYPKDLQRWIDFVQKNKIEPLSPDINTKLKNEIFKEADRHLRSQSVLTREFGPSTDAKYMEKEELLKAGCKYLMTSLGLFIILAVISYSMETFQSDSIILLTLSFGLTIGFMMTFGGGIYLLIRGFFRRKDYNIPVYELNINVSSNIKKDDLKELNFDSTQLKNIEQLEEALEYLRYFRQVKRIGIVCGIFGLISLGFWLLQLKLSNIYLPQTVLAALLVVAGIWFYIKPTSQRLKIMEICLLEMPIITFLMYGLNLANKVPINRLLFINLIALVLGVRCLLHSRWFSQLNKPSDGLIENTTAFLKSIIDARDNKDVIEFQYCKGILLNKWKGKLLGNNAIFVEGQMKSVLVLKKEEVVYQQQGNTLFGKKVIVAVNLANRLMKVVMDKESFHKLAAWKQSGVR